MSFTKIGAEDLAGKGVVGLPDAPGLSAAEMQRRMDEIAKEVIVPAFNRLIGELGAEGAAALIGAKDGEETSTVQAVMEKLTDALAEKVAAEMLKTADGAGMVGAKDGEETSDVQTLLDALKKSITDQTAEALKAAKKYTDDKAFAAGSADMAKSVYDPNGHEEDVFAYAAALVNNVKLNVADGLGGKLDGVTLTHTKSGTVHRLTGLGGLTGLISAQFKAAAAITEGDTLTVDGVSYTARMTNGEALATDFWITGATVGCIIDTGGKTVNFKGGGGVKLPALTNPATAAQIIQGYQAINGEGVPMEGTAGAGITKAATAAEIFTGYQALNAEGVPMEGTAKKYGVYTGTITSVTSEGDSATLNLSGNIVSLCFTSVSDPAVTACFTADNLDKTIHAFGGSSAGRRAFTVSKSGTTYQINGREFAATYCTNGVKWTYVRQE